MTFLNQIFNLQKALGDFEYNIYSNKIIKYQKVPFPTWDKLKNITNKDVMISIDIGYGSGGMPIITIIDTTDNYHLYFEADDNSFGEYLYNNIYKYLSAVPVKDLTKTNKNKNIKGENKEMENMFNFDFGPCKNNDIRVSAYGLAVKNSANNWVSYDPVSGKVIDVSVFNFDGQRFFYKIPVAIKDVKVGDMIIHDRKPVYVSAINEKTLSVIDIRTSEVAEILPISNMFGFDFVTKVVSILDYFGGFNASADSPFGNILPFLMMGDGDIDNILPFLLMGNSGANFANNPILLYFLMKDKEEANNFLPFLFLNNNNASVKN